MPHRPHGDIDSGSVAVITGSGKGIGRATAIEFAKAGYRVMINDLEQEDQLRSTVEEISKITGDGNNKIAYVLGDVSQEDVSGLLIDQTIRYFGRIDVLINNAGIAEKWQQKNQMKYPLLPLIPTISKPLLILHLRNMRLQISI